MGAFTTISAGADLQSLAAGGGAKALNELLTAYDEHRQILGQSAGPAQIVAGDDIQLTSLYYQMQNWIESNCTSFLDHDANPENSETLTYFTWASLKTKLGWDARSGGNGWQKSSVFTSGAFTMSTGKIADGDYIQSWLHTDLQNAFRELTRTNKGGTWMNGYIRIHPQTEGSSDWPTLEGFQATDWTDRSTWESSAIGQYVIACTCSRWSGYNPFIHAARNKGQMYVEGISTVRPHTASFYSKGAVCPAMYGWITPEWADYGELGLIQGKYHKMFDVASSSDASHTSDVIGAIDTNPYTLDSNGDPGGVNFYTKGQKADSPDVILDWAFTYT